MKKFYACPACGNSILDKLFITTRKGKKVSLHVSSQAEIRKSTGEGFCTVCNLVRNIRDFYRSSSSRRLYRGLEVGRGAAERRLAPAVLPAGARRDDAG